MAAATEGKGRSARCFLGKTPAGHHEATPAEKGCSGSVVSESDGGAASFRDYRSCSETGNLSEADFPAGGMGSSDERGNGNKLNGRKNGRITIRSENKNNH